MSTKEQISYHIDAGGETELDPTEYKIMVLIYRFDYDEDNLRQQGPEFIDEEYQRLCNT